MRYVSFLACAALSILSASEAMAQDAAQATAAVVPEKKICRREDVTGSNIPELHCRTKTEWAALDKQHEAEIRSLRDGDHWSSAGH